MAGIDSNTKAMLHCDGTNGSTVITDVKGNTFTAGGSSQLSTTYYKFGSASLKCDCSSTSNHAYASLSGCDFGTSSPFSVDMQIYVPSALSGYGNIFVNKTSEQSGRLVLNLSSGGIIEYNFYAKANALASSNAISYGAWNHIALTSDGSTMYLFLNGNLEASVSRSSDLAGSLDLSTFSVGQTINSSTGIIYYDEVRVCNICRWSSSFTPPSAAYSSNVLRYNAISSHLGLRSPRQLELDANFAEYINRRQALLRANTSIRGFRQAKSSSRFNLQKRAMALLQSHFWSMVGRSQVMPASISLRSARTAIDTSHHDEFCRYGYAVYVDGTYAGFIDLDKGEKGLSGVSLADGNHIITIRPSRWFWPDCEYMAELHVTVTGGAIGSKALPAIVNLRADDLLDSKRLIQWTWEDTFLTITPYSFGLWFGDTSPVSTSGSPAATISASAATENHYYKYTQTAAKYVAVAAMDADGNKGASSELYLAYPAVTVTSPASQWMENEGE